MKTAALLPALAATAMLALALPSPAPANPAASAPNGEQLFRQRCQACHQVVVGKPANAGPNLAGVVGRKAGSGQFTYSPALKGSKLVWTRANLDRYLTAPARLVPGTRMVISVANPAQREAIIQYLSSTR
jgi:cytochrome c